MKKKHLPRGLRLCNPGNIRKSGSQWKGADKKNPDKEFVKFHSMLWGYRALWITLSTYYHRHRKFTIRSIISRWAPPNENNTEGYIQFVADQAETDPDEVLPDPRGESDSPSPIWLRIITAITMMEQGLKAEEVDQQTILQAYKQAFRP